MEIKSVVSQYSIRNILNRSVVLDALVHDGESYFNIEIQKGENEDHIRRVRYHIGAVDTNTFDKGTEFHELQDLYVIFITKQDFLSLGKPIGMVKRFIAGTNIEVDNGVKEIYANTKPHDNAKGLVYELLQYIRNTDQKYEKSEFSNLVKYVEYYKNNENGVKYMSSILELERQEGIKEGIQEARLEAIIGLLKLDSTEDFISKAMQVNVETIRKIKCLFSNGNSFNEIASQVDMTN